ncbi:TetR/AcrR family transcriptional regulator [Spelaeicoccus albus]|nr:TetR family transcriptional regulator C-terminal domain-containing protein [Spelaeicoccus albus]
MVNLTTRQQQIVDAALRIVARDGLPAASFRVLAAEVGCSLGAVQKAFPSRDALLAASFARLRERAVPLPAGEPGRPTLHAWLVELLLRLLPLDEERRAAQRQGDAFAQWALAQPSVAAAIAESDQHIRALLASLVRRARAEKEIPAHVDAASTAWALLALAQGSASQLLYSPEPEDEVRRRLNAAIGAMLR